MNFYGKGGTFKFHRDEFLKQKRQLQARRRSHKEDGIKQRNFYGPTAARPHPRTGWLAGWLADWLAGWLA
jgi:hypothetical protein